MATANQILANPNYTFSQFNVDYTGLYNEAETFLSSTSPWTDTVDSATGSMLIGYLAGVAAYAKFGIESALNETRMATAKLPSSVYSLVDTLSQRISRKLPAAVTVVVNNPTSTELSIPEFTSWPASGGIALFNRSGLSLAANSSAIVTLYQGTPKTVVTVGTGNVFQIFQGMETAFTISDQDVKVEIDKNPIPVVTDNLWAYPQEPAVLDRTTPAGNLVLKFGNSWYGTMPSNNSSIAITYVVTDGATGNNTQFSGAAISCAIYPQISAAATSALAGGANEKSVSTYKYLGGVVHAANGRAVRSSDYIAQSLKYPGVADALLLGQKDVAPNNKAYSNVVQVSLLTNALWNTPSWDAYVTYMAKYGMFNNELVRKDPVKRAIPIQLNVYCFNTANLLTVKATTKTALTNLLAPQIGIINRKLALTDIFQVVSAGSPNTIDYLDFITPINDVFAGVVTPVNVATASSTTGTLPIGSYLYYVTALDTAGETLPSPTAVLQIAATGGITITWDTVVNALSYNVYGRAQAGPFGLLANVTSPIYVDTGSATVSATVLLPTVDTTNVYYLGLSGTPIVNVYYTSRRSLV